MSEKIIMLCRRPYFENEKPYSGFNLGGNGGGCTTVLDSCEIRGRAAAF